MLYDKDRDRNIDLLGKKVSIFRRTHIAVGHRILGGRPGPLRLPSAAAIDSITGWIHGGNGDSYESRITLQARLYWTQSAQQTNQCTIRAFYNDYRLQTQAYQSLRLFTLD